MNARRVLVLFSLAALGAGAARALATTYLPVLLERIQDAPALIGLVMTVNAVAGFAVPLAVGVWSDRRGRRLPFMVGGAVLTAGGLLAVALGSGSSYLVLALAAAVLYTGLNALTTAHRAIVAEDVADERRPAATSMQEVIGVIGAAVAVAIGGALIEPAPGLAFALVAVLLALAVLPTLRVTRRLRLGTSDQPRPESASLSAALRHPGARDVLLAQTLWVLAYAALPAFFVLYAEDELGLSVGAAGALPLAFGIFIAAGMAYAGRVARDRVHRMLGIGALLLGAGLLGAGMTSALAVVGLALAVAGLGAGLLTALGFPYFARFVPAGEAGAYSGVFFAGRGVASAVALPVAGLAVELTGTYRSVLWLGAAALLALVPLAAAERRRSRVLRPAPATLAAVIPVFASARAAEVARGALRHVDEVVLVDDGAPAEIARTLQPLARDPRVRVLTQPRNGGKGSAVAAGVELLLAGARPDAIVVLDSDGQHDPDRIPAFAGAARSADVVIGWRRDRTGMPLLRRVANRVGSFALLIGARRWFPDTQNGMRLFRTDALLAVPLPAGGYDAESRHLRALYAARQTVAPVEIPTVYEGEPSHFRVVGDTVRVGRALLGTWGEWAVRIAASIATVLVVALALPLLQPLDNELYLAVNGLGDGPEWLYQALDPHTRNYSLLFATTVLGAAITLRRARYVIGAALVILLAGYFAGAALEFVKLFIERARPEEVVGAQAQLSHGRSWAHIASFPSGHLIVTAALAAAAASVLPVLRLPLLGYVTAIGLTRVLFGAHFPLDVLVGAALGHQLGLFAVALVRSRGLLPTTMPVPVPAPVPALAT
jgi:MFS family permease